MQDHNPSKQRIVSLVPSQTEFLAYVGLEEEVVGITKFCVHPSTWFRKKQRVGGTKNLHLDIIRKLKPDLILANKEENTKEEIELLQQEFEVYVSDIQTIDDAFQMMLDIGNLTHTYDKALQCVNDIKAKRTKQQFENGKKAIYLIWKNPYMLAGRDTFIHEMMKEAGFENCVQESRYPIMTMDELQQFDATHVLLSSEPYPFKNTDQQALQSMLPNCKVMLVDGEYFSWYGSRMLDAFDYFRTLDE